MGGLVVLLVGGCRRPEPEPPAPPGPTPPTLTIPEALHAADLDELSLYDAPALADWRDREGQTAVHVAIHDGNLYLLDWLLRQHLDPCTPDSSGLTPLHRAVLDRRSEMVNRLLFESCDIDYRDHAWKTPAEYALELGYIDILERLAAAGADIELPSLDTPEEDTPEAAESQPRPQIRLEGDFRTWTSATGDTIEAEYVDLISDTLILRDRQGKEYRIHLFKLSRKDQILARQLQQGVTLISSKDLPAPRTGSRSTADKLARRSGWAILEDCRLLPNP
ncbi:MAG: ankyrin repeat domain-containing protein, partial [Kiritimatiellae bacterium]|nr:ankyrin repeat domain-containing protein [Kiritimatiellia bacterium]